jgi:hypothetical protein
MMHEIEDSILLNNKTSASGLIEWVATPSETGQTIDLQSFFSSSPYGVLNKRRRSNL